MYDDDGDAEDSNDLMTQELAEEEKLKKQSEELSKRRKTLSMMLDNIFSESIFTADQLKNAPPKMQAAC